MEYIPVKYIRAELKNFFDKHQTCTTIPSVCRLLQNDTSLLTTEYCNPFPKNIEALDDTDFQNCFFNSLYPLSKTLEAIAHDDAFSYLGETIFSKQYLFVVFLHENYALQTMHSHDYFEITYVYNGKCKLTFENDTISLTEGNVCIIAPGTRHEAFVLDASVKHFFTLLGNDFLTSSGNMFFTLFGKQFFTSLGKEFFT